MASAIPIPRFIEELEKLHGEMVGGNLEHGEYDQRLAATIRELRDRGIEGDATAVVAALDEALAKGTITDSVKVHLVDRLEL